MIHVQGLRKRFGSVQAVDDVAFDARDGAITGLLGPNGAGKTTTLRMLYGVMRPDAGQIQVDDVDAVSSPQQAQGRLGVLPDGFGLYPRLTAREHIQYFGQLHGISGARLRERTEDIPVLVEHFSRQLSDLNGWKPKPVTADAVAGLQRYAWPGNVRELRNVVERLLLLAGDEVEASDVRLALRCGSTCHGVLTVSAPSLTVT